MASYGHLKALLKPSDSFIVVANRNSEVDIVTIGNVGHILRWTRGRWRAVNLALLTETVEQAANSRVAKAVVRAALTLSYLRYGTLILVPNDARDLPDGGSIDRSRMGKALRRQIRAQTISELMDSGQFVSALSSDGLTAVAANGRILDTGRILSDVRLGRGRVGGARTAAARAASKKGLVIKVSADGPITLFRDGKELYETA
jgi:DNA integrity scanning protein DisA with diadenylate cyclase activity